MNYLLLIIVFLLGYSIGKVPFAIQWLEVRRENQMLKDDVIVLKEHLTSSGRGEVINTAVKDKFEL